MIRLRKLSFNGLSSQVVLPDRNCQFVLALGFIFLIASLLSQAVHLSILK